MTNPDRLIVIAGPSCCGKTTFINRLRNGELSYISETLRMGDPSVWIYADSFYMEAALKSLEESLVNKMILHWTLPHPTIKLFFRNLMILHAYDKKERIEFLKSTNELTILTLYTSQSSFIQRVGLRRARVKERRREKVDNFFKYRRKVWYTRQLEKFYSNSGNVVSIYDRWFKFCSGLNINEEYLVDLEKNPRLIPARQWAEIRENW